MEEHLAWVTAYSWIEDDTHWRMFRQAYFEGLPPIISNVLPTMVRRQLFKDLNSQGLGRHSREEIYNLGIQDLQAVSDVLGDRPFLMGEQPTSLDATGYGFMLTLLDVPLNSPLSHYARTLENIQAYCDRMTERYWPDVPRANTV